MFGLPKIFGKLRPITIPRRAAFAGGGGGPNPLPVPIRNQEQSNWCWCAVGSGIGDFYFGTTTVQCTFVSTVLGTAGCCGTSSGGVCDKPWYLDRALATAGCFERREDMSTTPTSFADVQFEINAQQPLGLRIQWSAGGGHFIAISGFQVAANGDELVTVQDPLGPTTATLPMRDLQGSYGTDSGNWTHSYFTAKSPAAGGAVSKAFVNDPALLGG